MDEKKYAIMVNMLTLVPLLIEGVQIAKELYDKMAKALQDGITDEEWADLLDQRKKLLSEIIALTESSAPVTE